MTDIYTVGQKNYATMYSFITLTNVGRYKSHQNLLQSLTTAFELRMRSYVQNV